MAHLDLAAALLVDEDVVQHRHHPGAQVGVGAQRPLCLERTHQGIVNEVVGPQGIPCQGTGIAPERHQQVDDVRDGILIAHGQ